MIKYRMLTLFVIPLFLGACGFEPVYQNPKYAKESAHSPASQMFAGVSIQPVSAPQTNSSKAAYRLQAELEDRLNPDGAVPSDAKYHLMSNLIITEVPIGVARDASVSRYNIYLTSDYQLARKSDGRVITRGRLRHVGSYSNATNVYFSTYVSRQDGIERGVIELAELYRLRLASHMHAGAKIDDAEIQREKRSQPVKSDIKLERPVYHNADWTSPSESPTLTPMPGDTVVQ